MRSELGGSESEGAGGELKKLEPFCGVLGLAIRRVGGVEGLGTVPCRRKRPRFLQRDGYEVRAGEVVFELLQGLLEIQLGHFLHRPFLWDIGAGAEKTSPYQWRQRRHGLPPSSTLPVKKCVFQFSLPDDGFTTCRCFPPFRF